jgi:hypothetical protein
MHLGHFGDGKFIIVFSDIPRTVLKLPTILFKPYFAQRIICHADQYLVMADIDEGFLLVGSFQIYDMMT